MTDRDVREALRRAGEGPEPDMSRLLDAVPRILAEAERRRVVEATFVPLAAWALPRLALATLVLLLISAALALGERAGPASLDAWILSDVPPLLDTILSGGDGHG